QMDFVERVHAIDHRTQLMPFDKVHHGSRLLTGRPRGSDYSKLLVEDAPKISLWAGTAGGTCNDYGSARFQAAQRVRPGSFSNRFDHQINAFRQSVTGAERLGSAQFKRQFAVRC